MKLKFSTVTTASLLMYKISAIISNRIETTKAVREKYRLRRLITVFEPRSNDITSPTTYKAVQT